MSSNPGVGRKFSGVYQSLERSKSRRSESRDLTALTSTPHPEMHLCACKCFGQKILDLSRAC